MESINHNCDDIATCMCDCEPKSYKPTKKEISEFSYETYVRYCALYRDSLIEKVESLNTGEATGYNYVNGFKRCKEEVLKLLKRK